MATRFGQAGAINKDCFYISDNTESIANTIFYYQRYFKSSIKYDLIYQKEKIKQGFSEEQFRFTNNLKN